MKNYIKILSLILGVFLFFALSCNGDDSGAGPVSQEPVVPEGVDPEIYACMTEENKELLADPDLPQYLHDVIIGTTSCPRPENSIDLINRAVADGTLRDELGHIFKLLAYVEPDRLREEFRTDEPLPDTDAIVSIELQWLLDYYATISDEVITEFDLYKFTLRPDNLESGFNFQKSALSKGVTKADDATPEFRWDRMCPEPECNIEIVYPPEHIKRAKKISDYVLQALPKLEDMFDVYVIEKAGPVEMYVQVYGMPGYMYSLARPDSGACEIAINQDPDETLDPKKEQAAVAYHLARCFHYELYAQAGKESSWRQSPHRDLSLAIGTYAIQDIFDANNLEQSRLDNFYTELRKPQWKSDSDNINEKGYMWFMFLKQRLGNYDAITASLKNAITQGLSALISSVGSYEENYEWYGHWNLNIPSYFHEYIDVPEFPTQSSFCGTSNDCTPKGIEVDTFDKDDEKEKSFSLGPGAIFYAWHTFDEKKMNEIVYTFKPLNDSLHGIRLYGKKINEISWELISDIKAAGEEVRICIQDKLFNEFILIFSNGAMDGGAWADTYTVQANVFCSLGGTTTVTEYREDPGGTTFSAELVQNIKVKPDRGEYGDDEYRIVGRTMEIGGSMVTPNVPIPDPNTGELLVDTRCTTTYSGTLTETFSLAEGPLAMRLHTDQKDGELFPYPRPKIGHENWVRAEKRCTAGGRYDGGVVIEETNYEEPLLHFGPTIDLYESDFVIGEDGPMKVKGSRDWEYPAGTGYVLIKFDYTTAEVGQ